MVNVKDIVLEAAGPCRLAATKYVSESLNRDDHDRAAQAFSGDYVKYHTVVRGILL